MKFNVNGRSLAKLLKTVIKGFDQKDDRSYVQLYLNTTNGTVQFTSRSESAMFQGAIQATDMQVLEGEAISYALDGAKLRELSSAIGSAPVNVTFSIDEKTRIFTVQTSRNKFKLPVNGTSAPEARPKYTEIGSILSNVFIDSIKSLSRIIDNDKSVQGVATSCLHIKFGEDLVLYATNGFALAERNVPFEAQTLTGETILMRSSGIAMLSNSFDDSETLTLVSNDNMFGYIDEDGVIALVGLIDLTPLNTAGVLGLIRDENHATLNKNDLKAAIELVSRLSFNDDSLVIRIAQGENDLKIVNSSGDEMKLELDTPAAHSGQLKLYSSITLQAISAVGTSDVKLTWGAWGEDGSLDTPVLRLVEVSETNDEVSEASKIVALMSE